MASNSGPAPFINFIGFNVAGNRFTTTKETILKEPASRIALMARGVLPTVKDENGAIFLDRDAKYFQLVLNYLRDGWCSLPKPAEERRELLQEIRYYQLAGMEAWMRTQDVMGEAALRPQSPDPYSSPNAHANPAPHQVTSSPGSAGAGFYNADAGFYSGSGNGLSPASSPGSFPIRSSFLNGPNQDLLTAGAFAGIRPSSIASPYSTTSRSIASPEPGSAGGAGGFTFSPSPSAVARPSSAGAYIGSDAAAGYAAGYMAAAQQNAERRSMSPAEQQGSFLLPGRSSVVSGEATAGTPGRYLLPSPLPQDGFKWTSRYLQNNAKMQQVVDTLLQLAYLPPHPSLHAGKSTISISSECDHDRMSSMLGPAPQGLESGRFRYQVVRAKSTMGWSFEFSLRPSSDLALYDKYNIAEFLQDNWFVLTACLKDNYGVIMEEDPSQRPKCVSCRRSNIAVTLQKFF